MTKTQSNQFQIILTQARLAGIKAVNELIANRGIVPMVVQSHANPLDDKSPVQEQYFVPDGVCGFAWVKVITSKSTSRHSYNRSLNLQFVNWMKAQVKAAGGRYNRKYDEIVLPDAPAYNGGFDISVGGFNQSMQKKETYAHAFAAELGKAGITAYSQSRMD